MDRCLRFDFHISVVARQISQRVSALRRVAGNLDSRGGILILYKAQIRPCMEYGALTWMSSVGGGGDPGGFPKYSIAHALTELGLKKNRRPATDKPCTRRS